MKNKTKIFTLIMALLSIFTLGGCTKNTASAKNQPLTITDSYNRTVSLEKSPEKVVSLSPGATETIFALGAEKTLVGRSDYCDYPAEASKIESVGKITDPSLEKIAQLKPDLVIAGAHFSKDLVKKMEDLGIKVAVLYGEESIDGAYTNIQDIAKVLGEEKKGNEIIEGMKKKVQNVEDKIKGLDKPSVYYVVGFGKSDFTAGGNTFVGKIIEKAGGSNIAADLQGWKYSKEKLMEMNPDIIVVRNGEKSAFSSGEGYKELKAVKEGKVYEIDNNMLDRQGPRQADGLEALAKILHPEAFK